MNRSVILPLLLLTFACTNTPPPTALPGAYRLEDGRLIAISHNGESAFRYRDLHSGASGRLYLAAGQHHYRSGPGWAASSSA